MRKMLSITLIWILAGSAFGDVVTERWGLGDSCRHAGTVTYTVPTAGGLVAKYDLSALPNPAKIIRARFRPHIDKSAVPLSRPLLVQALSAPIAPNGEPPVSGKPLALLPPRYVTLDATEVVRAWASGKSGNHGLWISGAKIDRRRSCLEITYEGKLTAPPPPVTGLKAFYRAGQVFFTWKEVKTPFAGKDVVEWKDLQAELNRIGAGRGDIVTYRIYRHTKPITPETIADAELLDEVKQHSAFDEGEIRTEWKGEQIKNVRVAEAPVPRTAVEPEAELPAGTGVFVTTCRESAKHYYAVVSAVNGVENTVALDEGNTAGPISEQVAPTQPILFRVQQLQYQRQRPQDCYVWWLDPPLSNLPTFIHLSFSPPGKEQKPEPASAPTQPAEPPARPFVIYNWWWGSGWNRAAQYPLSDSVGMTIDQNCMKTRGVHDGFGTYKAWSQGKVICYFIRQLKALLPWIKARYGIDEDRIYAISSGWAWHYPELFAATFECTSMNLKRSPAGGECKLYWGDPRNPAPTEWGVSAWEYWNAGEWIRTHPDADLAPMTYAPRMHTGDFGRLDKPPLFRALLDTKRAWSAIFHEGPQAGHYGPGWLYQLRRTDSAPAFANCSIDDSPGIGLGWDPGGQMNAYLCAEPRTQVDRPDRWEMTVYLYPGDSRGRSAAPVDECTADVTPRRCRQFKAKPGQKFVWTNTSLADGKVVQTGQAVADDRGLVTAKSVTISKGKNRLVIRRAE